MKLSVIKRILLNVVKFTYGFLLGLLLWQVMVQPYGKYFYQLDKSPIPRLSFALGMATLFMANLRYRCVMVLFLPSLMGSASQNYVLIALVVAIVANPISSVTQNASESVRVTGCSLLMAYRQVSDRAELLLSPVTELLKKSEETNTTAFDNELDDLYNIALDLKQEAQFAELQENRTLMTSMDQVGKVQGRMMQPVVTPHEIKTELNRKLKEVNPNSHPIGDEAVQHLLDLTKTAVSDNVGLELDPKGLSMSLDLNLAELMKSSRAGGMNARSRLNPDLLHVDLEEILHQNCLDVFRLAKRQCQTAADSIYNDCVDFLGSILGFLWCPVITLPSKGFCPYIIDQFNINETNICDQLRVDLKKNATKTHQPEVEALYNKLVDEIMILNGTMVSKNGTKSSSLDIGQEKGPCQRVRVKVSLNVPAAKFFNEVRHILDTIMDKYKLRRVFFKALLFLYDVYTSITLISIIRRAADYRKKYLTSIRFDNHYITRQFIKLDEERKWKKRSSLMPLKASESARFIRPFSCRRQTREEQQVQWQSLFVLLIFVICCLSLFFMDNIFYSILDSIKRHALIQFTELGEHKFQIQVTGEGSLAQLVRQLTYRLNSDYHLDKKSDTGACLPQPAKTRGFFYLEFLYLLLLYQCIDQFFIYAMRFRRLTAAFFYPDKETERIHFLYKQIQQERRTNRKAGLADDDDDDDNKNEKYAKRPNSDVDNNNNEEDDVTNEEGELFTARDGCLYLAGCIADGWRKLIVRLGLGRTIERIGL